MSRVVLLCLLLVAGAGDVARAQDSPDAGANGAAVAQPSGDGWDFPEDEEEAAPSWRDDLGAQGVDVAAISVFTVFAFVSFFRKSERLKYATWIAAVAYLGFYKSQLISIDNIFGLVTGNLPVLRYSLAWYVLAVTAVVAAVLWGRVYCGRFCAFGALTQLLDRIVPARFRVTIPKRIERRAAYIKYAILVGAVAYYVVTRDHEIYRYVEPFWMFSLHGTPALWAGLAVLLTATLFVRNLYCRFLCPVGAALGVLSNLTVFRIKRWSECNTCRICEKKCEWGAIRGPKIVLSECVRCDDCERLYEDTKKCPHHLIIIRKSEILARRAVSPVNRATV